jgi:UDP-N-acetylmuramyl tripeptide synthase
MKTLTNWNEFMNEATNNGTFEALVTTELMNEFIDRQVEFKVMETKGDTVLVKIYE